MPAARRLRGVRRTDRQDHLYYRRDRRARVHALGLKELIARRCPTSCSPTSPGSAGYGSTEDRRDGLRRGAWRSSARGRLQPWALHLIASQVNCPLAEWVVVGNPGEENPLRSLHPYFVGAPAPLTASPPERRAPGIGTSIDPAAFAEYRVGSVGFGLQRRRLNLPICPGRPHPTPPEGRERPMSARARHWRRRLEEANAAVIAFAVACPSQAWTVPCG